MMQYYFRDAFDQENCEAFDAITRDYPDIRFFQPSPQKAPWHVQAVLDANDDEPIVLNFWPHKLKGQRQPMPSLEGEAALRSIIDEALKDAAEEPFDVFEADE